MAWSTSTLEAKYQPARGDPPSSTSGAERPAGGRRSTHPSNRRAATALQAVEHPAVAGEPDGVVVVGVALTAQGFDGPQKLVAGATAEQGDADHDPFDLEAQQFLPDREDGVAASGARWIGEQRRF